MLINTRTAGLVLGYIRVESKKFTLNEVAANQGFDGRRSVRLYTECIYI